MKRIIFVAIIMTIAVNTAYCDMFKDDKEAISFADNVMKKVGSGEMKNAFELMKPYVQIPATEIDSVYLQMKSKRDQVIERIGNTVGYEFITNKKVGHSLFRLIYIEKTEKTVFFWSFYFYDTGKGWTLELFNIGDNLPGLFQAVSS